MRPRLYRVQEAGGVGELAGGVVVELDEDEVDGCEHGLEGDGGIRAGALGGGGEEVGFICYAGGLGDVGA